MYTACIQEIMMFIEKLNKTDFENLAHKFKCELVDVKKSYNNTIYVLMNNYIDGPRPEFWLSDFDCVAGPYYMYAERNVKIAWIKLLINKFGDSYTAAYVNRKNIESENEL